jgi:YegS/Rv2252/BmrU family lipid kinase
MTSVGVIAHSRKSLEGGLPELRAALERRGIDDPQWREVPKSKYAPHEIRDLIDAGVDLLFVWGGDGMVQRALDTVRKAPVTLAIVPAGTANLFATNLGIPEEIEGAVDIGLHGTHRQLDVGSVNGERFGVMAGTGFDAFMIRDADGDLKDRMGRLAYVVTGAKGIGREPVPTRIEVDGYPWFKGGATCVLVGNLGTVMGGIPAFPDARPDDGRLDVGVVTAQGIVEWARTLGKTAIGRPESSPFVGAATGTKIDVRMSRAMPYELDGGDRPPTKKLKYRVKPAAVTVCVPNEEETR